MSVVYKAEDTEAAWQIAADLDSNKRKGAMTRKVRKQVAALRRTTRRHARTVEKRLLKSGIKPNAALVESAAKYYPALKKLAEK